MTLPTGKIIQGDALTVLKTLVDAGRVYLKHHQEHHPVYCIGGCDKSRCGQSEFSAVLDGLEETMSKRVVQESLGI